MGIGDINNEIVERAEEVSGKPVLVTPDPALKLIATVKMARGDAPAHLVSFNPNAANSDYAVAFQCGFIIRTFAVPADERFDVGDTYWGRKEAAKLVNEHLKKNGSSGLSKEVREQVGSQIYDGLIRQLRSVPVGLRVDEWLGREYPVLHDQQRGMISRQLDDNLATLRPEVKRMAPEKVYRANVGMNAAFAAFWARQWDEPPHLAAYRASGHLDLGEQLLKQWDDVPHDPEHDRKLIDAWGERIGISSWYEFVPFRS